MSSSLEAGQYFNIIIMEYQTCLIFNDSQLTKIVLKIGCSVAGSLSAFGDFIYLFWYLDGVPVHSGATLAHIIEAYYSSNVCIDNLAITNLMFASSIRVNILCRWVSCVYFNLFFFGEWLHPCTVFDECLLKMYMYTRMCRQIISAHAICKQTS